MSEAVKIHVNWVEIINNEIIRTEYLVSAEFSPSVHRFKMNRYLLHFQEGFDVISYIRTHLGREKTR